MDPKDEAELRAALVKNCGLTPASGEPADHHTLLDELARRVDFLFRHDTEKLMYYLYALDVSEHEFSAAFAPDAGRHPARIVAEAILRREAERLHTRRRYEKQDPGLEE